MVLKALNDFIEKLLFSYKTIAVLGSLLIFLSLIFPFILSDDSLEKLIQNITQIGFAVILGLGALAIVIGQVNKKIELVRVLLALIIINVICLYVFLLPDLSLWNQRILLSLNGLILTKALTTVARYIFDEENKH